MSGEVLRLPINHYEGNYTCDAATLAAIEAAGQVVLRYRENPNGATAHDRRCRQQGGQRRRSSCRTPSTPRIPSASVRTGSCSSSRCSRQPRCGSPPAGVPSRRKRRARPRRSGGRRPPQHLGGDPRLAPRRVVDALAGAVLGGGGDEVLLEGGDVVGAAPGRRRASMLLRCWMRWSRCSGSASFRRVEMSFSCLRSDSALGRRPRPWAVPLQGLQVTSHGQALYPARCERRLVLRRHRGSLPWGVMTSLWPRKRSNAIP